MKKSTIVLIIFMAISIGTIVSTMSSVETYAEFDEAFLNPNRDYTVVGQLNKNKSIVYNPSIDPNVVSFYLIDKNGRESMVMLNQSKPQDMERSEDIVIKGRASGEIFYAHTILLKCPSKYAEENKFSSSDSKIPF